jgi:hypothetical protein
LKNDRTFQFICGHVDQAAGCLCNRPKHHWRDSVVCAAASSQDIDLKVIYQGYLAAGALAGPVSSDTLHRQLENMTGRQRDGEEVNNIGLFDR